MRFEGNHAPFGANMANDFMRLEDWVDKLWKTNRFHAHPCERPHESWLNSRNGEVSNIVKVIGASPSMMAAPVSTLNCFKRNAVSPTATAA